MGVEADKDYKNIDKLEVQEKIKNVFKLVGEDVADLLIVMELAGVKSAYIDEISAEFDELLAGRLKELLSEIENLESKNILNADADMVYPVS